MEPVANLAHRKDNTLTDVPTMLELELQEIRREQKPYNRALVLYLDDADGAYDLSWAMANMSCSQALALMEVAKASMLQNMGVLPGG